jgi:uncharacterized oxidoreductase
MKTSGNTILVTGGATGIGFAIAERFSKLGNNVIICGRRQDRLDAAKKEIPSLHVIRCDISKEADRKSLLKTIESDFKGLNVLVNNAGIQRPINLKNGNEELLKADDEIETNLKSQIHLSALFIPLLSKGKESAIVNVSSGLGFVPLSRFPVYSATKAALHSFTMSLRHQLKDTGIRVFELIPPIVHDTELSFDAKGKPIKKEDWTVSSSEVAETLAEGFKANQFEIAVGPSKRWVSASKADLDKAFQEINR